MVIFKILYPIIGRIPSEKAKIIQIMRTTSWLALKKNSVVLIVPKRRPQMIKISKPEVLMKFYGINFLPAIIKLPNIDLFHIKNQKFAWYIHILTYFMFLIPKVLSMKFQKYDILFLRDLELLYIFVLLKRILGVKLVFELHNIPKSFMLFKISMLKKTDGIIAISDNLKRFLLKYIKNKKILVIHDAFQPQKFENENKILRKIRENLEISPETHIVIYTGHLYPDRKVENLIDSMKYIKNRNVKLLIVGGTESDFKRVKEYLMKVKAKNVILKKFVPPSIVPYYLKLADIGIITLSYESPLKLFEYMGYKLSIIAVDSPSLREIIHDGIEGIYIKNTDPKLIASKIDYLLNNQKEAKLLAENAYQLVINKYTFEKRAIQMIHFFEKI
ncbi:MAG: glycosyltransferase family 4 protein [Candidatus Helarchaeota archaeon]